MKNWLQTLLGRSDGAIAKWNKHFADVSGAITASNSETVALYQKLKDDMEKAEAIFARDRSPANHAALITATVRHQAGEASYANFCAVGYQSGTAQLESKLDTSLLRAAIKEARHEIEKQRTAAAEAAAQLGDDSGAARDLAGPLTARFGERLEKLNFAERCIQNTELYGSENPRYPRGYCSAASSLATALQ